MSFGDRRSLLIFLRLLFLLLVAWSIWSTFRHIPNGTRNEGGAGQQAGTTSLHILMRLGQESSAPLNGIPIEVDSVDVAEVKREFSFQRRSGVRFEDFLSTRRKGHAPLTGRLDDAGQAVLSIPSGSWWIDASVPGVEDLIWHLPVEVYGREETIELTRDNAYMRSRSF